MVTETPLRVRSSQARPLRPTAIFVLRFECLTITHIKTRGSTTTIQLSGELDFSTSGCVREAILLAAAERVHTVRVDLSGLVFCDCSALASLARVHADLKANDQRLDVFGVRPPVIRLIELTHLGEVVG